MKFGEKLKALRKERGLTQNELAKAVGVGTRSVVGWEQEGRYPRKRELYAKLAEVLGTEENYLLTEDEQFVSVSSEQYGSRGKRQAEQLVAELSGLFAGGELTESDKDAVMIALQKAYFDCKEDNKKYTPKAYRPK